MSHRDTIMNFNNISPQIIIIIIIIIVCLIKTSSGSQKTELHDVKCYKAINSKKILYYNAI
jgi:hypothetical protein